MECIFCRIIRREFGEIIYENGSFVVLMDIGPLSRGHMLVVPKYHGETLEDIPDEYLSGALVLIKKIVGKIGTITKYNVLQNNGHIQSVPHVHFHIVPYNEEEGEGLKIQWERVSISKEEIATIGESYKKLLEKI